MINMMDRMTRMEADMVVNDQMNQNDMESKSRRIAFLEDAMGAKDEDIKVLTGRINVTEKTALQLRELVIQVRWFNSLPGFYCQ